MLATIQFTMLDAKRELERSCSRGLIKRSIKYFKYTQFECLFLGFSNIIFLIENKCGMALCKLYIYIERVSSIRLCEVVFSTKLMSTTDRCAFASSN